LLCSKHACDVNLTGETTGNQTPKQWRNSGKYKLTLRKFSGHRAHQRLPTKSVSQKWLATPKT